MYAIDVALIVARPVVSNKSVGSLTKISLPLSVLICPTEIEALTVPLAYANLTTSEVEGCILTNLTKDAEFTELATVLDKEISVESTFITSAMLIL